MNSHISTIVESQRNLRHLSLKIRRPRGQVYTRIADLDLKILTLQVPPDVRRERRFIF